MMYMFVGCNVLIYACHAFSACLLSLLDAPRWDRTYDDDDDDDDESEQFTAGHSCGGGLASTPKCFAQAALSHALRVRSAVQQAGGQHVKVLRCKY
jgi:hypothetical protein